MKFDKNFKIYRFRKHYKQLYPCEVDNNCKAFLNSLSVDLSKPVLIINEHDWMRQVFLTLFMRKGFVDYKLMSGYSLLDIYLGNNEDTPTVMEIKPDVLCVYLGYGEFENKRQVDVIIQVVNNLVIEGKIVWIYCRGTESSTEGRCPGLINFFKQNKYNFISKGGVRRLSDEI